MQEAAKAVDVIPTLEYALNESAGELKVQAVQLGANAVAVLFCSDARTEVTYFWDRQRECDLTLQPSFSGPSRFDVFKSAAGAVNECSPLARILGEVIPSQSRSFLLFPWRVRQQVVTVVFCFAAPEPPDVSAPEALAEKLKLIGLATWSVKAIAELRSQLKTVNTRLAGRKLVEQAKGVLQRDQGISEETAYEHLRRLSRQRRITLAALAEEVLRERRGVSGTGGQFTKSASQAATHESF
jgi:hypothetical protein